MKTYPSISHNINYSSNIYMFDKLDGSNIRVEWNKKKGFNKFGSRTRLLGTDQEWPCDIPSFFMDNYSEQYYKILVDQKYQKATLFFEFWGDKSFAGNHNLNDTYRLTLIDCNPYKKGWLDPRDFCKIFGDLDHAKLLYNGTMNKEIVEDIKLSKYPGITFEGVICKGLEKHNRTMFKIKTNAWIDKLKNYCGDNDTLFEKLK